MKLIFFTLYFFLSFLNVFSQIQHLNILCSDSLAGRGYVHGGDKKAAKYIASQPLHSSQKIIEETTDHTVFCLNVNVSEELIRTLLSYGGEVRIQEPESLRFEIEKRAKAILENKL